MEERREELRGVGDDGRKVGGEGKTCSRLLAGL